MSRSGTRRRRYTDSDNEETVIAQSPPPIPENAGSYDEDPLNTFKIMVASDIHLGFCDNDTQRADDSFNTFEEILETALKEDVDFVLLGGDLFHENRPKPATLQRTIDVLRKYCLSDRQVCFDYISDPNVDFKHLENPEVNFKNPNINVGLPVFTIHGNHDDPVGPRKVSAVDHLASAGLLNHFGMYDSLNEIEIQPVLLQKGDTKLALYGLGCMKDDRLFRMFRDGKVQFLREENDLNSWFNLFVLHQNRVKHGPKNYIPPIFFPSFLNLVIWGHEHESKILPVEEETGSMDFAEGRKSCWISQPGSSVATSLCEGEQVEKQVGILYIRGDKFRMKPIKLKTVRPFMFDTLYTNEILANNTNARDQEKYVEDYVAAKVNQLVDESAEQLTGHPKQPVNPLVRVRIGYSHESEIFNPVRFAQRFAKTVANDDIVLFMKCRTPGQKLGNMNVADLQDMIIDEEEHDLEGHVEEIVETFFTIGRQNNERAKILEVLSEKGLSEGVKACVEKNDKEAISALVDSQIDKVITHLLNKNVDKDSIDEELEHLRDARNASLDQEAEEARNILERIERLKNKRTTAADRSDAASSHAGGSDDEDEPVIISDGDDEELPPSAPATATRGRGRGSRGPRGGRARGTSSTSARGTRGSTTSTRARSSRSTRNGF